MPPVFHAVSQPANLLGESFTSGIVHYIDYVWGWVLGSDLLNRVFANAPSCCLIPNLVPYQSLTLNVYIDQSDEARVFHYAPTPMQIPTYCCFVWRNTRDRKRRTTVHSRTYGGDVRRPQKPPKRNFDPPQHQYIICFNLSAITTIASPCPQYDRT